MNDCHSHNHTHNHKKESKSLLFVLILTAIYMVAEFLGGIYTNSLALTADAGHMLGDVGALALSFFAVWISTKPAPVDKTYGYFRAEIFAAFLNGVTLVIIALFIIYEAYLRITSPPEINSLVMMLIAFGGFVVNLLGAFLLHSHSKENLNIKGAFLHILGDLLGSVGAILAGFLIYGWKFYLADPIISVIIAVLVLYSSIKLVNSAFHILMEAAPSHLSVKEIEEEISKVEGVKNVHDLHVWSINSGNVSLSVHVVADIEKSVKILCAIDKMLLEKFNIKHSTIQIEPEDFHRNSCSLV